jgi:hypothetical protein
MTMSDEQQPELRWAPMQPKPSRAGRVWMIVGLAVAELLVEAVVLFFVLPRSGDPEPGGSASPSSSASATPTPTPTTTPTATTAPTATATPDPEPSTPVETQPPVADPSIPAFQGQVSGWLNDAVTGLDIVSGTSGQDALSVIDTLQNDAQRLSETSPPSSISSQWTDGVAGYSQRLGELREAVSGGSSASVDAARSAVENLRSLVGL